MPEARVRGERLGAGAGGLDRRHEAARAQGGGGARADGDERRGRQAAHVAAVRRRGGRA